MTVGHYKNVTERHARLLEKKCKGVPEVFILLENEMQILSKVVSGFHVRVLPVKEENKISNNDLRKLSVRKTN